MNTEKTGGAAFPINTQITHSNGSTTIHIEDGMTLLDYFAAKAMPTILASMYRPYDDKDMKVAAMDSYKQAAAMIEERKKYINQ
jgi:hypothetical protein